MSTPNPIEGVDKHSSALPISSKTYHIAGILTTVYGMENLPLRCDNLACLWLLHPRLQTKETMSPIASHFINAWNGRQQKNSKGLIAVSFDQRNHGSRQAEKLANEAWRQGNPT